MGLCWVDRQPAACDKETVPKWEPGSENQRGTNDP